MSTEGVGGQKKQKTCQRSLWTTPYDDCFVSSPWKLDSSYAVVGMGLDSYDYYCFQQISYYILMGISPIKFNSSLTFLQKHFLFGYFWDITGFRNVAE